MPAIQDIQLYIEQQRELIRIEKDAQNQRYGSTVNAQSLKELRQLGLIIHPLKITHRYFGLGDFPLLDFQFVYGTDRSLFKGGTSIEMFGVDGQLVPAQLMDIDDKGGSIKLLSEDFPDWIEEKGIGMKIAPDNRTFGVMDKIMIQLQQGENENLKLFANYLTGKYTTSVEKFEISHATNLNESQQNAIQSIMGLSGVMILHGPPGTGKTTTIAHAVQELKVQGKKVVAGAPSNAAVDHLTRQLISLGINVVRLGNNTKIQEDILPFTPEGIIENAPESKQIKKLKKQAEEYRKLASQYKRNFGKEEREQRSLLYKEVKSIRKEINALRKFVLNKTIENADVICGTPIALYDDLPEGYSADMAILDESGQCIQPLAWCVMKFAKNIVFVGDPFQLPPTLIADQAMKLPAGRSILEAFFDKEQLTVLLDTQYRMDEQICSFSNSYFYENKLKSATPSTENSLLFYDTAGSGAEESNDENSGSRINKGEVDLILQFLQTDYAKNIHWSIISPYQGQVSLLKEQAELKSNRISTVDSFQGQEDEGIILSLVRSNHEQKIGFLNDYRRMNVAITRAKKRLVIFADSATIGNDPFYKQWIEHIEKLNAYHSAFELMYS